MPTRKSKLFTLAFLILVGTEITARPQTPGCYPKLPPPLSREVDRVVLGVFQNGSTAVTALVPRLVSFTIADVVASNEFGKLSVYEYYGDVGRTDQQVGASSTSSGSTSAVEKPGLLQLLGFAVERGAIQQSINESTVTLSTSPYALVAAAKRSDSPQTYQDNELLTRLGVSATFVLNDPNNALASVSRKQLTEWSARVRLTGDRSTRSEGFQKLWQEKLGFLEQQRVNVLGELETRVFNVAAVTDRFRTGADHDVLTPLRTRITDYLTANNITPDPNLTSPPAVHGNAIRDMILCTLFNEVHEPTRTGTIRVDEGAMASSLNQLTAIQQKINDARAMFKKEIKRWTRSGTLSTFAYTNHRVADNSDYSEFKLLFERHVAPLEVILNAGFSIYNKPDQAKNQEKLRDFLISGSLEWASSSNPLFRGEKDLATPITVSMSGRYQRLMENENMAMRKPDIANFQARLEVPVAPGISIPMAYTYATATEMMPKRENRFNVGLQIDINKILSFQKATRVP